MDINEAVSVIENMGRYDIDSPFGQAILSIKKFISESAKQTHNSAMDAISASEEYESSEVSRGVKCISRAFLAGVEWQKQHQ